MLGRGRIAFTLLLLSSPGLSWPAWAGQTGSVLDLAERAGRITGVPADLIISVVVQESGGRPYALHFNGGIGGVFPGSREKAVALLASQGSSNVDIGLMQVNYRIWGAPLGLAKADLLDPEVNVLLGALILRHAILTERDLFGGIGRYHSATLWRKRAYASQVLGIYKKIGPALREIRGGG